MRTTRRFRLLMTATFLIAPASRPRRMPDSGPLPPQVRRRKPAVSSPSTFTFATPRRSSSSNRSMLAWQRRGVVGCGRGRIGPVVQLRPRGRRVYSSKLKPGIRSGERPGFMETCNNWGSPQVRRPSRSRFRDETRHRHSLGERFLANHGGPIIAADFFVAPTVTYRLLFVLVR